MNKDVIKCIFFSWLGVKNVFLPPIKMNVDYKLSGTANKYLHNNKIMFYFLSPATVHQERVVMFLNIIILL